MNKLYILLVILSLPSCMVDNPRIEIHNKTKEVLTKIELGIAYGFMEEVDSLKAGDSHSSVIMFDNSVKGDGAYLLNYKINDIPHTHAFGYFTNGKSMDRRIIVTVEPDTIKYSFH